MTGIVEAPKSHSMERSSSQKESHNTNVGDCHQQMTAWVRSWVADSQDLALWTGTMMMMMRTMMMKMISMCVIEDPI